MIVAKTESEEEKPPVYWLMKLAETDCFKEITNPVEWQRQIRKDRLLIR